MYGPSQEDSWRKIKDFRFLGARTPTLFCQPLQTQTSVTLWKLFQALWIDGNICDKEKSPNWDESLKYFEDFLLLKSTPKEARCIDIEWWIDASLIFSDELMLRIWYCLPLLKAITGLDHRLFDDDKDDENSNYNVDIHRFDGQNLYAITFIVLLWR